MAESMTSERGSGREVFFWSAAFVIGMCGMPLILMQLRLGFYPTMALMLLPMLLLIPMSRAIERHARAKGNLSRAMTAYNRRMLMSSFIYVAALLTAIWATNALEPTGVLAWLLALLPALPIMGMLWAMGRYLAEEQDEYLRTRQVNAALIATGLLLALATFWGFLEIFDLVPHAPSWWAVPIWSLGLGVGHAVQRARS